MSSLSVHQQSSPVIPDKVLNHAEDIVSTLAGVGIKLSKLRLEPRLQPGMPEQEVLAAIAEPLLALQNEYGLGQIEVISLDRNPWPSEAEQPLPEAQEWLSTGPQLYLCLAGQAQLNLHIGDYLYALAAEPDDLLVLPAGTRYWLSFADAPRCVLAILRETPECAGAASGDAIAGSFNSLLD